MKRLWEVDFFRGIAIILMVIFNWSFTLKYFSLLEGGDWLYWFVFPRFIAFMFIFIVGVSLVLSYSRVKNRDNKLIYSKYLKRGLKIFSLGLGITIATYLTFPTHTILFGILHLIGLSIILAIPFLRFKKLILELGLIIIGLGLILENFIFDFPWLLWLGFIPETFTTFDYFPVLPWFGVVLLGLFVGKRLYRDGERNFKLADYSKSIFVKSISFLGKHSLLIYLIHQPILLALLFILRVAPL